MATSEKKEKLFELIKDFEYGMLVTETSDGSLRSRPMSAKTTETDDCIWFLTNKESAKILEIKQHSKVNVSFAKPGSFTFISISGTASVTDDQNKIDEVWTADAGIWFPGGKDDPDLTLVKVDPTDAEYWCSKSNMFVSLYKIAMAKLEGEKPDLGINQKVEL